MTLALLANIAIGIAFGRSLLRPISDLLAGIRAIGEGRLDQRVHITRDDEFRLLGDAFNATADKLGELQQAAIRQERQAMFGRIAAGLVHDLSHPIQNINNNCKLVLQMHDDAEYRATFAKLVKREFSTIQRTFEDLRNLARPIPLEKFPVDAGKLMLDVVERMQAQASVAGVTVAAGGVAGAHPLSRGRPLRARAGAAQPRAERAAGHAAWRARVDRGGRERRSRAGARVRHRLRDSRRSYPGSLRGLRDDEAARAGTRPCHLAKDRGAARRVDHRDQHGWRGQPLHAGVPAVHQDHRKREKAPRDRCPAGLSSCQDRATCAA